MSAPDTKVTGTLSAVNDACVVPLNQAATVRFQISGTFTGTWQLEGSMDGSQTWQSVYAFVNAASPGSRVSSGTTTGIWDADVAGWTGVRIRCSAITSGSIVVSAIATPAISTSTVAGSSGGGGGGGGGLADQGAAAALSGAWPVKVTDGSNAAAVKVSAAPIASDPALVIAISPNTPVGGGTQYAAGSAQATPTGTVALGSDGTAVRALSTDATGKLNITDSGGSLTIDSPQLPSALVSGRLPVDGSGVTQPVSAAALPLPTGAATSAAQTSGNSSLSNIDTKVTGVALDATLLGGSQKTIARGGAKGATSAADVTSTAEGTDHQAIDVQLYHGGTAVNPTQIRALASGTDSVTATISGSPNVAVTTSALPTGAATEATLTALSNKMPTQGQATMAASQPVAIASNQSAVPVSGTVTANIGTAGTLALDATLTGGSAKTIARGGAKGSTTAADLTSTASGANHQALDVVIYDTAGNAITSFGGGGSGAQGTPNTTANAWPMKVTDGTNTAAVKAASTAAVAADPAVVVAVSPNNTVAVSAASLPLPSGAATAAKQPALGTSGVASSDVLTVQGTTGMMPFDVRSTTLAADATLTGGTAKAIARGGAKGSTTAADLTSTASGANHQPLDVAIYDAAGNQITSFGGGTQYADGAARGTATGTVMMVDDGTNVQSAQGDTSGNVLTRQADLSGSVSFTATGSNVILPTLHGAQSLSVTASGTFSASSLVEGTIDGTNWVATALFTVPYIGSASSFIQTTTSTYSTQIAGWKQVRLRCSSFSSGTQVLNWTASQSPAPFQMFALSRDNGATIAGISTSVPAASTPALNVSIGLNSGWENISATLSSAASSSFVNLKGGKAGCAVHFSSSTYVGTIIPECTLDGSTYVACNWIDPNGAISSSIVNPASGAVRTFLLPSGAITARIRGTAFSSGSVTYVVTTSTVNQPDVPRSCQTAATTGPSMSTASAAIIAANPIRKSVVLWNSSGQTLYVLYGGGTATTAAGGYTLQVANGAAQTIDFQGALSGILSTGSGNISVTEIS